MTQFSLLISFVNRDFVFAVDSIHQPWLNFQRWFLVLQWLSFWCWFLDQHWQSVFDNSILSHQFIFAIDFIRKSCWWFQTLAVTQISVVISRSTVTMFSLMISCYEWHSFHRRFHASMMTLFSLLISFVNRELVFAVDSIRHSRLNFQRWFLVL